MEIKQNPSNGNYQLHAAQIQPFLADCGYGPSQLAKSVELEGGYKVALAAFAHPIHDTRSACIAVIDNVQDPLSDVEACRSLGAPLVLAAVNDHWELWMQEVAKPQFIDSKLPSELPELFNKNKNSLAPETLYRAKTWARLDKSYQLSFVDLGLMPVIEEEAGKRLEGLIERIVLTTKSTLGWRDISEGQGEWLLKSNFWLLAAKILKDKNVPAFISLDLSNLNYTFACLAQHYGASEALPLTSRRQEDALKDSAREIARFGNLGVISHEALAFLYENALITKETRAELGTHSTPNYLVDYIIGKLRPWIEEIDPDLRYVFEPACGHAGFLLSVMRVLTDLLPESLSTSRKRRTYLRSRLYGCDIDRFALEIARLSLTLADVPNPNGWHLERENIFAGNLLAKGSRWASIILANPSFENFSPDERRSLDPNNTSLNFVNKAAEMLWRVVTNMRAGSVFGVVLPQRLLDSKEASPLRQFIAKNFEIGEICLFPDKVFTFSGAESAVLFGRRLQPGKRSCGLIPYRRVREKGMDEFKREYQANQDKKIRVDRISEINDWSFFVPDLEEVWEYCKTLPKFGDIAYIGKGFDFRSPEDPKFPPGAITESKEKAEGLIEGYARLYKHIRTHKLPTAIWMNMDTQVIKTARLGTMTGIPQVLMNYFPVSRGPWRLKAFIDKIGHPVTSGLIIIRPKRSEWTLETLWAICNSPFANAYAFAFSSKRNIQIGNIANIPVPNITSKGDLTDLQKAVEAYLKATRKMESLFVMPYALDELKYLHWQIDAEVLRLYGLTPDLERQIMSLFSGEKRRGVPFDQIEYLPESFTYPITLRDLLAITIDWDKANKRRAILIHKKVDKEISSDEIQELNNLQRLADLRIHLLAPLPLSELEKIQEELKGALHGKQSNWIT